MNNAKIWLVVQPTVGIPLFLTGVAVASFSVHVTVLRNTSWVSDYLSGRPLGATAATAALEPAAGTAKLTSAPAAAGQEIRVTLPNGQEVRAVVEEPATTLASLKSTDALKTQ